MNKELGYAFQEHFLLPTWTCLFLEIWQVIRGLDFLSASAFLHILLSVFNLAYLKEYKRVLEAIKN